MKLTAVFPRSIRLRASVLLTAFACCFAIGPAIASTNSVSGSVRLLYGPPSQSLQRDSFEQQSGSSLSDVAYYIDGNNIYTQIGQVNARAGFGSVGISASTSYEIKQARHVSGVYYETYAASGTAKATFSDVLVTGPGTGSVSTRLRMRLRGSVETGSSPNAQPDGSTGSASVSFGIYVNGNLVGFGNLDRISTNGVLAHNTANGLFTGFSGGGVVTTSPFSVPLNTRITLELELFTAVHSTLRDNVVGAALANSQFYQSLSFATDRPVFDLPTGYTANSSAGAIIENSYQPNTNAPVLNIRAVPNGVALSWVATNQNADLEYTTNAFGSWSGFTSSPILTNSQFVMTWTNKAPSTFFRLKVPGED